MFNDNMKITVYDKPFLIKIENIFNDDIKKGILDEIIGLEKHMVNAGVSGDNGVNEDMRKNTVTYLDTIYSNRENSTILKTLDVLFLSAFIGNLLDAAPYPLNTLKSTNYHETQLSRYGNDSDFYDWHIDSINENNRIITAVYYTHKEPKKFTGGEISITNSLLYKKDHLDKTKLVTVGDKEERITLKPEPNTLLIFGANVLHAVGKTTSPTEFEDGRFSIQAWIGKKYG